MTNEELCLRYRCGEKDAANELIENNMAFIRSYALKHYHSYRKIRLDADDLTQVGSLAMLRAAERFDPAKGLQFLTYAGMAIQNAIIDEIRKEYPEAEIESLDGKVLVSGNDRQVESLNQVGLSAGRLRRQLISSYEADPERIYLQKEALTELHGAINALPARGRMWVITRFGFEDDVPRSLAEMVRMFRLTENRARETENKALERIKKRIVGQ